MLSQKKIIIPTVSSFDQNQLAEKQTIELQKHKSWPRIQLNSVQSTQFRQKKLQATFFQSQAWQYLNQKKKESEQRSRHYFLPYFMRLKIKDIYEISYSKSSALMNGTLILNIGFADLCKQIDKKFFPFSNKQIQNLKSKILENIVLQIKYSDQLKLEQTNQIQIKKGNYKQDIKITVRKDFKVLLERKYSQIFFSPFQKIVLVASFGLHKIVFEEQKDFKEKIQIHFCSMNYNEESILQLINQEKLKFRRGESQHFSKYMPFLDQNHTQLLKVKSQETLLKQIKLCPKEFLQPRTIIEKIGIRPESLKIYSQQLRLSSEEEATYGDFKLSTRLKAVQSSGSPLYKDLNHLFMNRKHKQGSQEDQNKSKKYYSQYTHFCFTLYRDPFASFISTVIPIMFLGILSLVVFFLQRNLAERVGVISTLLLGFIQLVPSIRAQIIDPTKISAIEVITYLQTLTCFLSLIDSFNPIELSHLQIDYFTFIKLLAINKLFLISVLINLICLLGTVLGLLYFRFIFQKKLLYPQFYRKNHENQQQNNKQKSSKFLGEKRPLDYYLLNKILQIPDKYKEKYSKCWNNKGMRQYIEKNKANMI